MLFDLVYHFPFPFSSEQRFLLSFYSPDISGLPLQAFSQAAEELPSRFSFLDLGLG